MKYLIHWDLSILVSSATVHFANNTSSLLAYFAIFQVPVMSVDLLTSVVPEESVTTPVKLDAE